MKRSSRFTTLLWALWLTFCIIFPTLCLGWMFHDDLRRALVANSESAATLNAIQAENRAWHKALLETFETRHHWWR